MSATTTVRRFVLDRLYPTVLDGVPGLGTPQERAAEARAGGGSVDDQVDRLILRHLALASSAGFVSGLGGWLTLPVALPANLAAVASVQLHMGASMAVLAGHDPRQPGTRQRVLNTLVGSGPADPARDAEQETLDRVGLKLAERGLNVVVSSLAGAAKWGAKKVVAGRVQRKMLRGIPLVGGFIGAASDGYVTKKVAEAARAEFFGGIPEHDFPPSSGDGLPAGVVPSAPDETTA
ncbi:EcsC family protein [Rubrivirga sp. IMCC45206]|uniref:EcsC family protein n=1 Tax=Rubrivirga sp. IMCC45206 TaxID=3391614 RepID=UPI0039902EA3